MYSEKVNVLSEVCERTMMLDNMDKGRTSTEKGTELKKSK